MTYLQAQNGASALAVAYNNVVPISPRSTRLCSQIALPAENRVSRRRASFDQGRALETLGHAVEYLVDSGLFVTEENGQAAKARQEAIQILMQMSRLVFSECREVVSLWERLGRAVEKICAGPEGCSLGAVELESRVIHLARSTRTSKASSV